MKSLIVIMGVCGSGKSTIAEALSQSMGASFLEGDDYHPPSNIAKMSDGRPLTNKDRIAWIEAMAMAIKESNKPVLILSCSALNAFVRERLTKEYEHCVTWVYLKVSREELTRRMLNRNNHFMKENMIDSQLTAMEPPMKALTIDGDQSPEAILEDVLKALNDKA